MDYFMIIIFRSVIYVVLIFIFIFMLILVKQSFIRKKMNEITVLFILMSVFLPYITLFLGNTQKVSVDYTALCESYESIKSIVVNDGKKINGLNNTNVYCLEGETEQIGYSISYFEENVNYQDVTNTYKITSGSVNGIDYAISSVVAQRPCELAYSFTGVYSGEIVLNQNDEFLVIDYSIYNKKWYNVIFVSRVPNIEIANSIINAIGQSGDG